ncbi:hypothetical protein C7212DRAFT_294405, partial [Tuber magnatum]
MVRLLLEDQRVDFNILDYQRKSPLQLAARAGHEEVVRVFLEQGGIDLYTKPNVNGESLLSQNYIPEINWAIAEYIQNRTAPADGEVGNGRSEGYTGRDWVAFRFGERGVGPP